MASTGLLGPGTLVRDAIAPELLDATITTSNDGAHSAVEVAHPGEVAIFAVTGTCSDDSATLDLEVQGSDSSSFSSGVVSYGRFAQIAGTEDGSTFVLEADVRKRYLRVVSVATGTASFPVVVTVRTKHDRRSDSRTA
jgi:hypothetical protein